IAFIAPAMSLVAECVRSVGVSSGAPRLWRSSEVFVGLFLFMLFFLCMGLILFRCRLARQRQKTFVTSLSPRLLYPIAASFSSAPFNPQIAAIFDRRTDVRVSWAMSFALLRDLPTKS